MKNCHHTLLIVIGFIAALPASQAAVLFSDDFESYTANNNLNTSGSFETITGLNPVVRNESTSTVFGSPNQYGEFYDANGSLGIRAQSAKYTETFNAVSTFQFDFSELAGGGGDSMGVGFAFDDLNTGGSRARVQLNDGLITGLSTVGNNSYSLDTLYTFYMIFNDTTSSVAYAAGTLAASSADIWLQESGGSPVYAGSVAATNSQDAGGYSTGFRTFNSALQDVDIDNVSLFEGAAAIPEPSSVILGLAGGLLLLRRRR